LAVGCDTVWCQIGKSNLHPIKPCEVQGYDLRNLVDQYKYRTDYEHDFDTPADDIRFAGNLEVEI